MNETKTLSMDRTFQVVEIFESINGEGAHAGELAVFVRMKGCNLKCAYCDTTWANEENATFRAMTTKEILEEIEKTNVVNITLTGGEPLLQPGIEELLYGLAAANYRVEIETNGSVVLTSFRNISPNIVFTMDYKLAGSGMECAMKISNFDVLQQHDTVKFVVSDRRDLERAYEICEQYLAKNGCHIFLSPVFGEIELEDIVEYMKEKHWTKARMQIQMHKVIWNPEARGV